MAYMMNYKRILVAVDGSQGARYALEDAVNLVKGTTTRLDVLRVLDLNTLEYGGAGVALDGERIYEIEQEAEQEMLRLRKEIVEEKGLDDNQVYVHLRFGNPKRIIAREFPQEYKSNLIVLGYTGRNFIERVMMGSVAAYVTREALCDVLTCKGNNETK